MKPILLVLSLCLVSLARAGVVEVINATENPLRFSSIDGLTDSWVAGKSSRRWMVPDTVGPVTYTVENVAVSPAVGLGSFVVLPEKYYVAGYDSVSGFVASERLYDSSAVMVAGSKTREDLVSWVKYGMFIQFMAEIAGFCIWALKQTKATWSSTLWGEK